MKNNQSIAVLITSYNRKKITLNCLNNLHNQNFNLDVYLVIDGSIDGTKEEVQKNFSYVNCIDGSGESFWNQGMRLAWKMAAKNSNYDFFMWLNDDTKLKDDSLSEIFDCYYQMKEKDKESIVVGACQDLDSKKFTYGGRNDKGEVLPNKSIQPCKYINGNIVLISSEIFLKLGYLSNDYTHAMGDIDYGLRALKNNISLVTTKKYIGFCSNDKNVARWCDPNQSITNRWKNLNSPKGLNLKEYKIFRKKFWPKGYMLYITKVYFRFLFPGIYNFIKRN